MLRFCVAFAALASTLAPPGERVLVSLIDGSVVTLDAWSGAPVGTFGSGGPLVSASGANPEQAIVPGLDGSIYELRGDGAIDELPFSAAEIAALDAPAMQCAVGDDACLLSDACLPSADASVLSDYFFTI